MGLEAAPGKPMGVTPAESKAATEVTAGTGPLGRIRKVPRFRATAATRAVLGAVLTACASVFLARSVGAIYPIADWLFWRYVVLWLWLALFSAACASFGQLLLVRLFRLGDLPALESAALSMVLGTVAFVMLMYGAGSVGLFKPWFAVALPLALLAFGRRSGVALWKHSWQTLGRARTGPLSTLAALFGCCCLGVTYLRILTPDALGYDATWFYVKVAQDYARWGRIQPFLGDYSHELPHLASLLYTWGYLLPGLHVALRWVFALHMEMCLLAWTLVGISAAVARQVEGPVPRATWAVFFLFPGSFVFGLWGTGDHITAFFSIGVALALLLAVRTPSRATFGLLAVPLAGGILTKYQAVYLGLPALGVAAAAWGRAYWRQRGFGSVSPQARRDLLAAPFVLVATCAVLLAPHFVQNIVYHHNPVYPLAQRFFTRSIPSVPNGWLYFDHGMKPAHFVPPGSLTDKLSFAFKTIVTPSLLPRSLQTAACSLFVLLLPALAFLPKRGASAVLALIGGGALLVWGATLFDLRHIETFTPVLVASTAALILRLWRQGFVTRLGLVPLLVLQIAWSADAAFWDSSQPGIDASLRLIHDGLQGKGATVFDSYRVDYRALGQAVPRDAKLVIHTFGVSLGIDRDIFMDSIGFQGLIDYSIVHTPRELYDRYRALGVTHLVHEPNGAYASPTKQEDILFHGLAAQYGVPVGRFGGLFLTALPKEPPPVEAPYRVACAGLDDLTDGIYPIAELRKWSGLPDDKQVLAQPEKSASEQTPATRLETADAVLCPPKGCPFEGAASAVLERRFELIGNRISPWQLYLKRAVTAPPGETR
jgi:hypothetical protein